MACNFSYSLPRNYTGLPNLGHRKQDQNNLSVYASSTVQPHTVSPSMARPQNSTATPEVFFLIWNIRTLSQVIPGQARGKIQVISKVFWCLNASERMLQGLESRQERAKSSLLTPKSCWLWASHYTTEITEYCVVKSYLSHLFSFPTVISILCASLDSFSPLLRPLILHPLFAFFLLCLLSFSCPPPPSLSLFLSAAATSVLLSHWFFHCTALALLALALVWGAHTLFFSRKWIPKSIRHFSPSAG